MARVVTALGRALPLPLVPYTFLYASLWKIVVPAGERTILLSGIKKISEALCGYRESFRGVITFLDDGVTLAARS